MSLPPEIFKGLVETFIQDVGEQTSGLNDALLSLETTEAGEERDELFRSAMRMAHSIKGSAQSLGNGDTAEISHSLESLFTKVMKGDLVFSPETADICFEAIDKIRAAAQAFQNGAPLDFDHQEFVRRLDEAAAASGGQPEAAPLEASPEAEPAPEPAPEPETPQAEKVSSGSTEGEPGQEAEAPQAKTPPSAPAGQTSNIRVDVQRLDRVDSLIEEINAARIDIDEYLARLHKTLFVMQTADKGAGDTKSAYANLLPELEELYKSLTARSRALRIVVPAARFEVHTMRMVPATGLTQGIARSVRDLARQLGKSVGLEIHGEETRMDRAIVELLSDPLTHLIRNAMDHGMELPDVRRQAGKPEKGLLKLSFALRSGQIEVVLSDDGGGIDPDAVYQSALKKGIVASHIDEGLSDAEKVNLIFRPGFSTKSIITDVSGRGVGLDIVRENIERIQGEVEVTSRLGKGTTFTLKLPATLASERALIVTAGEGYYAIPSVNIERVLEIPRREIVEVDGRETVLVNGKAVALASLASVLKAADQSMGDASRLIGVLLSSGSRRVVLIVDVIINQREVIVRPFPDPLIKVRNFKGCTQAAGRLHLVLNPTEVINSALQLSPSASLAQVEESASRNILVVDDSLTSRTLVKSILETAGFNVTTAVNGEEGWNLLQTYDYDLVLTDVEMPVMDGFELTEAIKNDPAHQNKPVVLITSLASDEDKERGVEVGADAYIVKGEFETQILLDIVNQLI